MEGEGRRRRIVLLYTSLTHPPTHPQALMGEKKDGPVAVWADCLAVLLFTSCMIARMDRQLFDYGKRRVGGCGGMAFVKVEESVVEWVV